MGTSHIRATVHEISQHEAITMTTDNKQHADHAVAVEIARAMAARESGHEYTVPAVIQEALDAAREAVANANHSEARIRAAVSRNATDSEARIRLGLIIGGANEAETKEIA
jgi:hypothetical protein